MTKTFTSTITTKNLEIHKNHLNISVVFKSRTAEIVHFIIEYDAGFHAFLWNDGIKKSKFSGNQIFGESEFSM